MRIVANAGGLNPAGLAERLREVASGLGLSPHVAHVEGDGLVDRAVELGLPGKPLTANAYLGGFGIAAALQQGADVVVTGRVTDASLVVGPAVAELGWGPTSYDELAGAVVAGHVIECGTQATGGNFSGFTSWREPLGFPIAEVHADGSSVITKHAGTGGVVSVDTVTAQLVYEIQGTTYLGPDVSTHLDTIALSDDGPDRVRISGVRGSAPPETLKVCVNELGGYRNQAELVLVGLDIEEKADWVRAQVSAALAADPPAAVEWSLARTDHEDADTEEAASCRLRVSVRDEDPNRVGKAFTAPLVELALASYPGFTLTAPPAPRRRTASTARHTSTGRSCRSGSSSGTAPRRVEVRGVEPPGRSGSRPPASSPAARSSAIPGHSHAATPRLRRARRPGCRWGAWRTRDRATRAATRTSGCGRGTVAPTGRSGWRTTSRPSGSRSCCRRRATSTSRCTHCRTWAPSTSCCRACSARGSPPRRGSTRRPRRSGSGCGRGTSTYRRNCCDAGSGATSSSRWRTARGRS